MADIERVYNVPLRKVSMKAPKYKRTMKAVKALREFLVKHMKCENVKIGKYANLKLHERGRKNPPHHIQIKAIKTTEKIKGKDVEIVIAELVGAPEEKKKEVKEELKKKEEIKGETITAEDENKVEKKEKEEDIKKEVLEKPLEKEKEIETKVKIPDKEKSIMNKEKKIIAKTKKPIHEKKK